MASAVVMSGGVDAAVVGASLVKKFGVSVSWVAQVTPASSVSSSPSVEPALVTVAAGGVTGQSVTAGVARVLILTLQRTQDKNDTVRLRGNEAVKVIDEEMRQCEV